MPPRWPWRNVLARFVALTLLAASPAGARAAEGDAPVEEFGRALQLPDQVIHNLLQRVEALEREVRALREAAAAAATGPGAPVLSTSPGPPPAAEPSPPTPSREDEEERLVRAALERTLIQRGGLLLPRWRVEVEPSLSYFHSSSDTISIDGFTILPVLVIGDIVSERVRRDTLQAALTFRMGLPWGIQWEERIPFRYELERTVTADNQERRREGSGVGDLEFALSRQLVQERGWVPDLLASVRWKSATGKSPFEAGPDDLPVGTGFHGIQGTLTAVKARDPVVFIAGLSYAWNLPDRKPTGRIDPGDTWGMQLGLALALSLETSINFGLEQRFTTRTSIDGRDVPGSYQTVGVFRIGASYIPTPGMSVDVGVGIGLTRDAPDVQITGAVPIRFPR